MGNVLMPLALLRSLPDEYSGVITIYRCVLMSSIGVGMAINSYFEWFWSLMIITVLAIISFSISGLFYQEPEKLTTPTPTTTPTVEDAFPHNFPDEQRSRIE